MSSTITTNFASDVGIALRTSGSAIKSVVALNNNASQTLTGTAPVQILYQQNVVSGKSLTTGTNSIVANDAGLYSLNFLVNLQPVATGVHVVSLLVNGAIVTSIPRDITNIAPIAPFNLQNTLQLAAGSIITVTAQQPTAGAAAVLGVAPNQSRVTIEKTL